MNIGFKAILGITTTSVIAALVACAIEGPSFTDITASSAPVAPDQTRVVLLRRKDRYDDYSASKATIRVNDQKARKLGYGGFFYVDVPPGEVTLRASARNPMFGTCELRIPAVAGNTVYVDIAPRTEHIVAGVVGSAVGGAAAASGSAEAASVTEAVITDPVKAAVGSTAGGTTAQVAESAGKPCGGPFALIQLVDSDALRYLDTLAWSK